MPKVLLTITAYDLRSFETFEELQETLAELKIQLDDIRDVLPPDAAIHYDVETLETTPRR